ncbi:cysteine desulfurase family protein [Ammoniphilus sp. YIM 78166]|uniref:cysteine desulfurase family protein n=1 Tax=Ammoniphilus sp. YIM 78166 TaxID=1644106 RepID=UPI00106F68D9|nr:cysteine desulfurase family protein [Ammoniphilus sp. YIM 78166]
MVNVVKDIYFDHAASTFVFPQVLDAMIPYFEEAYGNPSSVHRLGRQGRRAIDEAREQISSTLGAEPNQIVFTSSGTEADNMALMGIALANRNKGNHIITSIIEHHAVLHTCEYLKRLGFEVTYLPVDQYGMVDLKDVKQVMKESTILISVMYGNNEVGTLQPIKEIAEFAKEKGVAMHTDAIQAYGSIPIDISEIPVDSLSISSHKINGPKGVGALFLSGKIKFTPLLHGGQQEKKRRAGTENVPGIVGFAKAAEFSRQTMEERRTKYIAIREEMTKIWKEEGIEFMLNGHPTHFLPHILNVSFPEIDTEVMLMSLDMEGIYCSSGSACASGSLEASHVVSAMYEDKRRLKSAIRFSFGLNNTVEDGRTVAKKVVQIIERLR